jgi:hypothetical protein
LNGRPDQLVNELLLDILDNHALSPELKSLGLHSLEVLLLACLTTTGLSISQPLDQPTGHRQQRLCPHRNQRERCHLLLDDHLALGRRPGREGEEGEGYAGEFAMGYTDADEPQGSYFGNGVGVDSTARSISKMLSLVHGPHIRTRR